MEKYHIDQLRQAINRFSPISDPSFESLKHNFTERKVKAGYYILNSGDVVKKMYFVCTGIINSEITSKEGSIHIKNFFQPGNFATSTVSALTLTPSSFALKCLKDSIYLEIDYQKFKFTISRDPELQQFYISYLEEKWVIENEKRQISFAIQTAKERYLTFLKDYPSLEGVVAQHQIASFLGITPTQLSRIRKNL